jgi:cytoskeletal protein CcmA (bactofilin family)
MNLLIHLNLTKVNHQTHNFLYTDVNLHLGGYFFMSYLRALAVVLFIVAGHVHAADKHAVLDFNKDRFVSGTQAIQDATGVDDLFMFGDFVHSKEDISGSLHVFGRRVRSEGAVGQDAYLSGYEVNQSGTVAGDLTVSGIQVTIAAVNGDLRASGNRVELTGEVGGYALVAGDEVIFDGAVKGDVSVKAEQLEFGKGAHIEGQLILYEAVSGSAEVPAEVITEERITRRDVAEWEQAKADVTFWDWRKALVKFFIAVLIITAIAAWFAAIVPRKLADLRRGILDRPFWSLLIGVLTMSVIIGSAFVLLITGYGMKLIPVNLAFLFIAVLTGYVVGSYAIGVAVLLLANRPEPNSFKTRAIAAATGAIAAVILFMLPYVGWLLFLSILFAGLGAISKWLFRPRFMTD